MRKCVALHENKVKWRFQFLMLRQDHPCALDDNIFIVILPCLFFATDWEQTRCRGSRGAKGEDCQSVVWVSRGATGGSLTRLLELLSFYLVCSLCILFLVTCSFTFEQQWFAGQSKMASVAQGSEESGCREACRWNRVVTKEGTSGKP